jgi:addiction module HigA family antidote
MEVPTMSKSRITIKKHQGTGQPAGSAEFVTHRMPRERPPTPPGEMLLEEFIKPLGITQTELALRLGVSYPRLNEIIRGKRAVTPDTALRLARVLGMSADFWLGLQSDWDLWHAMRSADAAKISQLVPLRTIA